MASTQACDGSAGSSSSGASSSGCGASSSGSSDPEDEPDDELERPSEQLQEGGMGFCEPRERCDEWGGGVPLTRMELLGPMGFVLTA